MSLLKYVKRRHANCRESSVKFRAQNKFILMMFLYNSCHFQLSYYPLVYMNIDERLFKIVRCKLKMFFLKMNVHGSVYGEFDEASSKRIVCGTRH